MATSANSLVTIPRSDWCKLRDLYGNQRIASSSFSMLQCLINWVRQNPKLDIEIFSLNGDWESDGTFVVKAISFQQIYCNTLSESLERLIAALNCLDSQSQYLIAGFPQRILPAVEQFFINSGLQVSDANSEATIWYHKPKEEISKLEINVPSGVRLACLDSSHAEYINNNWPHRSPGSVKFVEHLIVYNESIGAFAENGELMAYCLQLPFGALGLLRVKEQHRRKALAQLVVRSMAKILASKNFEVVAPVVVRNEASRSLFEKKLGFHAVDKVYWAARPAIS